MPDFRGLFLRGVGGNSAAIGVQQGDAIRNITAEFGNRYNAGGRYGGAAFWVGGGFQNNIGGHEYVDGGMTYFDVSRVVPTAEENRPVNKAVRFFIRAAM